MTERGTEGRVHEDGFADVLSDVTSIARSPQAVVGFLGRTERGPVNEPALIRSYNHFRQVFGGHASFSHVSWAVQQFFLHGGRNAVVVRLVNRANRALIRVPAGSEFLEIEARQPGSREFLRVSVDYDGVEANDSKFNLIVQRLARQSSQFIEDQEIFPGVSVQESASRYLGDVLARSRLVALRGMPPRQRPDATVPNMPGEPVPYLEVAVRGTDGNELTDYDIVGSDRDKSGLWSLDAFERIDLVCLPPPPSRDHGTTTFLAAERYCAKRRAMLIWDPPHSWINADTAIIGARETAMRSSNAMTYFPRLRARVDRVGLPSLLPACGAIAGLFSSRSDSGDWQPGSMTDPASKISLAPMLEVDADKRASLYRAGVNVLAPTGYGGSVLTGNVTLASPGSVSVPRQSLDRRRLALFIVNSLESAGAQALARSGDPLSLFEERAGLFLRSLEQRGAFTGSVRGESLQRPYFLRHLPSAAEPGAPRRIRVGFAPHECTEYLTYDLEFSSAGC
ncbi:MAG TPA: hypothetical protein VKQ06_13930, partial [Gammaproteobacteria bacterium]|nr:hypothetical protein [Gammaproteobacteria bacterium]